MNRKNCLAALLAVAALGGCKHRDDVWDSHPSLLAQGLKGSAALIDVEGNRALMLPVEGDLTVSPVSIPFGRGHAADATTTDGSRLFILTHGVVPRRRAEDEKPSLTVIDGGTEPRLLDRFELSDPLSGLEIDPENGFAIVYPSLDDLAFVKNPNELVVVDLAKHAATPVTLRSFGGRPESFFFTPSLELPGGPARLLVALTDRDVGILDLGAPELGDVTVPVSTGGEHVTPAGVAVSDGEPGETGDARLAFRLENDPNVIIVDLLPKSVSDNGVHTFKPSPNIVFAGGTPSDIAFVRTDGGTRLAALVPSEKSLVLIDPVTGTPTSIDLGAAFDQLSIVTDAVGGNELGADVALVWSNTSPEIGFVTLGKTVGKPYKSLDKLVLEKPIAQVYDVPAPNDRLKLLVAPGAEDFFILDLLDRTAAPILASSPGTQLTVGRGGRRAWLLADGAPEIAALNLDNFHPVNLELDHPAAFAFDVERRDGQRALIAVHDVGDVGLTVFDGLNPSLENAMQYEGVLLGNLQ